MSDIEFIPGLVIKPPRDGAPEFVKFKGSIKRAEMLAFCMENTDEWINFDVKESKGGKIYAARDNWKPSGERQDKPKPASKPADEFEDSSIPF